MLNSEFTDKKYFSLNNTNLRQNFFCVQHCWVLGGCWKFLRELVWGGGCWKFHRETDFILPKFLGKRYLQKTSLLCNISNIHKSEENESCALFTQLQLLTHGLHFSLPCNYLEANPRQKMFFIKTKANSRDFPILLNPISAVRTREYTTLFFG